ncbi:hypothetical protein BZG36_04721 [Bifiguratus adelaidae]|uniref:FAD/NAD(P)-binding domain-containing protein n=1 Tax=Bifiguratus adelaidae TaxID=1938954 RepID=A0A261XV14_9FUNG|nr:hypothetical protein BZG36_04721 [Bifiguratus adelaidae]
MASGARYMASIVIYDALVIGGSYAGLTAALSLGRVGRHVLLIDSGKYRNERATGMHGIPTAEGVLPQAFRDKAKQELQTYPTVQTISAFIDKVQQHEGQFLAFKKDTVYRGRKLLLAAGVNDVLPPIPGFEEYWGRGIIHCIFCHGYEHRGKSFGALVTSPQYMAGALMAQKINPDITLFLSGIDLASLEAVVPNVSSALAKANIQVEERAIKSVTKDAQRDVFQLHLEDGTIVERGTLLYGRPTEQSTPFAEQLGVELDETNNIKTTSMFMTTNVKGVFAAGDCATMIKGVT